MIKASVVGATGYTGEELVYLLAGHPGVEIGSLSAIVDKPTNISDIFPRFKGRVDAVCERFDARKAVDSCDVAFLALPHTVSMEFAPIFLKAGKKVIDLSADYRLPVSVYEKWYGKKHTDRENLRRAVYGLPELYRSEIKGADFIANPGCYPTSVVLAAAPLLKYKLAEPEGIIADVKSGVTGAGRKASLGLLFAEVADNFKAYKIGTHQHSPEINQQLGRTAGRDMDILFVPHVIPTRRGILSTVYLKAKKGVTQKDIDGAYAKFYGDEPFVRFLGGGAVPELKDVLCANFCDVGVKLAAGTIVAVSAIDNLTKGAAGQAVQNMNIICGLEEKEGLM